MLYNCPCVREVHTFAFNSLSSLPQVAVQVNDVPASCPGSCSFQYLQESTPSVDYVWSSPGMHALDGTLRLSDFLRGCCRSIRILCRYGCSGRHSFGPLRGRFLFKYVRGVIISPLIQASFTLLLTDLFLLSYGHFIASVRKLKVGTLYQDDKHSCLSHQ